MDEVKTTKWNLAPNEDFATESAAQLVSNFSSSAWKRG